MTVTVRQPALLSLNDVVQPASVDDNHGEIFTRRWVVELILDLVGYTDDRDLADLVAVEPACGTGAFVGVMVERLSRSARAHGRSLSDAGSAIEAHDLLEGNVAAARARVADVLTSHGWPASLVSRLAKQWVTTGDFLLAEDGVPRADVVVGNPPYLRLEDVPDSRMAAYRGAWQTMVGRADIYVGFFEAGLRILRPDGRLGFICADRWMRNQYGARLRELISDHYSMELSLAAHDLDAFERQVSAYPAITVIRNGRQGQAVVAEAGRHFCQADAARLLEWTRGTDACEAVTNVVAARLPHWFDGSASWPAGSPARLALLERLNDEFEPLEDVSTGTRVGIGVATGADRVFVVTEKIDVEDDRLLPLAMSRDTTSGRLDWSGHYLVNPWDDHGALVDLAEFPKLARYFRRHTDVIAKRHVATRLPAAWYRTIDKVDHLLVAKPKLYFPDMKMRSHPVLDTGGLYPHHGLYFIESRDWDLKVLGGLLLSRVAELFVDSYAVKMRGGTLRFQAQYLRRIRVPRPETVSRSDARALAAAFDARDESSATRTALRIYQIDEIPD